MNSKKKKGTNYEEAPVVKSIPAFINSEGKIVDLANITANDIVIEDIAHSLSNQCRYNGHTDRFYSVAEHSARLCRYAQGLDTSSTYHRQLAKVALLHDAAEAYIGDVIFHLKGHLPQFKELERKIEKAIFEKFGLTAAYEIVKKELHELDRRISFDEMYTMFNGKVDPWFYENRVNPIGPKIMVGDQDRMGWTPAAAKMQFLICAEFFGWYEFPKAPTEEANSEAPPPVAAPKKKKAAAKKKKSVTTKKKAKK